MLGQIVDARDIIKALIEVSAAPASPAAWFNLITALIGLIPGGGDVVKRSLRVVKARAVPIDKLLDFIRQYYKGDPEKLLREMLDLGKLRKVLDTILNNPKLLNQLDEPTRKQLKNIQNKLGKQFNVQARGGRMARPNPQNQRRRCPRQQKTYRPKAQNQKQRWQ